jgi:Rha family phage regulatory protein
MQTSTPTSAIELYRELVMLDGDEGYTTSVKIAARFSRPHSNVLRAIDRMSAAIKSRKSLVHSEIFKDCSYVDSRGKLQRQYLVKKDGFMLLAMRFEGEDALDWQLNFVAAFNWLVEQVQDRAENRRLMAQFDIKERASIADGSYHGRGLRQRRTEIPQLNAEAAEIAAKLQTTLLLESAPPSLLN